jgi:D-aminopeptidase
MPRIAFFSHKKPLLSFAAEEMECEKQEGALLLSARGAVEFQDSVAVQEMTQQPVRCNVRITEGDSAVVDARFDVTLYALEADSLTVALA